MAVAMTVSTRVELGRLHNIVLRSSNHPFTSRVERLFEERQTLFIPRTEVRGWIA